MTCTTRADQRARVPAHAAAGGVVACRRADVVVAQGVEDAARVCRGRRRRRRCCGRGGPRPGRGSARGGCGRARVARTRPRPSGPAGEPCLVIRPRCTVVSDSWCFGVSPAQQASCSGRAKRCDVADLGDEHRAQDRADPGDRLDRAVAGVACAAGRATSLANSVDLEVQRGRSAAAARRSAPAYAAGSASRSSSSLPGQRRTGRSSAPGRRTWPAPRGPGTCSCERSPTSLARCRTSSRSSRVAGGAIHASGSRPIRSRSARSAASRSSFFTRRYANALTPNGCARCTVRAELGQGVRRPVPAVGGLQHHLRGLPGAGHHLPPGTPGRWRSAPSPTARRSRSSAPTPTGADADPSRRTAGPAYDSLTGASFESMDVSTPSMSRGVTRSGGPAPSSHQPGDTVLGTHRS